LFDSGFEVAVASLVGDCCTGLLSVLAFSVAVVGLGGASDLEVSDLGVSGLGDDEDCEGELSLGGRLFSVSTDGAAVAAWSGFAVAFSFD